MSVAQPRLLTIPTPCSKNMNPVKYLLQPRGVAMKKLLPNIGAVRGELRREASSSLRKGYYRPGCLVRKIHRTNRSLIGDNSYERRRHCLSTVPFLPDSKRKHLHRRNSAPLSTLIVPVSFSGSISMVEATYSCSLSYSYSTRRAHHGTPSL